MILYVFQVQSGGRSLGSGRTWPVSQPIASGLSAGTVVVTCRRQAGLSSIGVPGGWTRGSPAAERTWRMACAVEPSASEDAEAWYAANSAVVPDVATAFAAITDDRRISGARIAQDQLRFVEAAFDSPRPCLVHSPFDRHGGTGDDSFRFD